MRKYDRQAQTLRFAITVVLVAMLAFALIANIAKADDQLDPRQVGFWYGEYTSDSRQSHTMTIIMVINAIEAYAYGKGVDFDSDMPSVDTELMNARYINTIQCFGGRDREDVVKAFFGWALRMNVAGEITLGLSVALFTEAVCHIASGDKEST